LLSDVAHAVSLRGDCRGHDIDPSGFHELQGKCEARPSWGSKGDAV
jgi:hypothetical protein